MTNTRADEILDFAEREMRKNGFDAVSFRDIANAVGIKSASVHYHFPTKADLSSGVTARYADRFIDALGLPDDPSETAKDRITRLANAYVQAFEQEASACLCAVLGSVISHLPEGTSDAVQAFYARLTDWTTIALKRSNSSLSPKMIVSMLQGAMVLSIALGSEDVLFEARDHVIANV